MARPKVIKDDEIKDVKAWIGKRLWERMAKIAHDRGGGTGVSTLLRELAEERYGKDDDAG